MAEAVAVQIDRQIDRHAVAPAGSPTSPRRSTWPGPRQAATEMLAALGLPIDSEDMFETPRRLVHAYAEMLTPPEFDSTTFSNAAGYDELVLVSDIPVHSLCEHHLLPFTGRRPRRLPAGRPDPRACRSSPVPWSSSPAGPRPRSD